MLGGVAIQFVIDGFRDGITVVGDVAGEGWHQLWCDAFDLVFDLIVIECQMLGADEENVVCLPFRNTLQ